MPVAIRMLADWTYWLDPQCEVSRTLAKGLVLTEPDDIAAAAIAAGTAEPLNPPLSDEMALKVEIYAALLAGVSEEEIATALAEPEGEPPAAPPEGEPSTDQEPS